MFSAAISVSVGAAPPGAVAAAKSLLQASPLTRVMQPANRLLSVLIVATVAVCELFRGSWTIGPRPPVLRSARLGTFPAAIRRPSAGPLSVAPFRNCAPVQTDASVVNSSIVRVLGGVVPSTDMSAMAGLSTTALLAAGVPPLAITYSVAFSVGALAVLIVKWPSAPVRA